MGVPDSWFQSAEKRWISREGLTAASPGLIAILLGGWAISAEATKAAFEWLASAPGAVGVAVLLLVAVLGWSVGIGCREVGFLILSRLRRGSGHQVSVEELLNHVSMLLGEQRAAEFLTKYPGLKHLLTGQHGGLPGQAPKLSGYNRADGSTSSFHYAKQWLETRLPSAGVASHEITINLTASSMLPGLLGIICMIQYSEMNIAVQIGAFVLLGAVWIEVLGRNFRNWRQWERLDAIASMARAWDQGFGAPANAESAN